MERFMLSVIFVLSAVMAFACLHNAQDLSLPAKDVINLSVFGGLMAVMTLTSGIGLALRIK